MPKSESHFSGSPKHQNVRLAALRCGFDPCFTIRIRRHAVNIKVACGSTSAKVACDPSLPAKKTPKQDSRPALAADVASWIVQGGSNEQHGLLASLAIAAPVDNAFIGMDASRHDDGSGAAHEILCCRATRCPCVRPRHSRSIGNCQNAGCGKRRPANPAAYQCTLHWLHSDRFPCCLSHCPDSRHGGDVVRVVSGSSELTVRQTRRQLPVLWRQPPHRPPCGSGTAAGRTPECRSAASPGRSLRA